MISKFKTRKYEKACKTLLAACKFRDKLYKMDKVMWTKAAKRFERVHKMLLKAGDAVSANHAQTFVRACKKRAEIN